MIWYILECNINTIVMVNALRSIYEYDYFLEMMSVLCILLRYVDHHDNLFVAYSVQLMLAYNALRIIFYSQMIKCVFL